MRDRKSRRFTPVCLGRKMPARAGLDPDRLRDASRVFPLEWRV
jgi:hypothetical protein